MNPENTHKLMGLYTEFLRYTLVHGFRFFKLFPIGVWVLTVGASLNEA